MLTVVEIICSCLAHQLNCNCDDVLCVICSIESHSEYFYMDLVQRREHLVPWLDIAPSDEVTYSISLQGVCRVLVIMYIVVEDSCFLALVALKQ